MNKQKEIRSTGNPDFSDSLTKEIIEYMARKGREAKLQGKGMRDKKYCCTCRHCDKYHGTCYNMDSDHCADLRRSDDSCEKWEAE